jgi:hypothetical protein
VGRIKKEKSTETDTCVNHKEAGEKGNKGIKEEKK